MIVRRLPHSLRDSDLAFLNRCCIMFLGAVLRTKYTRLIWWLATTTVRRFVPGMWWFVQERLAVATSPAHMCRPAMLIASDRL